MATSYGDYHSQHYPHAAPTLPPPTLPSSRSFSDEVDRDMRQRQASAGAAQPHHDHHSGDRASLIFPPGGRARTGGAGGGGGAGQGERNGGGGGESSRMARQGSNISGVFPSRPRPRSQSSPYAGQPARDSVHTILPYDREQDGYASTVLAGAGPTYGAGEDDGRSLNLGGSRPPSRAAAAVGQLRGQQASTTSLGGETTALDYLYLEEDGHEHPGVNGQGENGNGEHYPGEEDERAREAGLSKEEAWYFLRELVGQELRHEEGLLWKLKNLDAGEGEVAYDEYLDPQEAPLLRYLIRHFLLTLPLIRDTSSDDVPSFWTDGLYPIIRAVHDADFSKPTDRGTSSTAARLYRSALRTALERFVSAGLKLSSSTYDSSDGERLVSVPMQAQPSTSSSRYNFQPAAPPPAEVPPQPTVNGKGKIRQTDVSDASSPSPSTSSRRFSLSRLFGGVDRSPVRTAPPPVPHPPTPPHLPSDQALSAESGPSGAPSSDTDGGSSPGGPRRKSAGPARPDSGIMPTPLPFGFRPTGESAQTPEPLPSIPPSQPASRRPSEVERLDLSRTASRTTGLSNYDTASFVSAQESAAARTAETGSENGVDEEEGDVTVQLPAGLAVPPRTIGGEELVREGSAAGTVRMSTATDTEGFEYWGSDAANTPTTEKAPFEIPSAGGSGDQTPLAKGKEREVVTPVQEEAEPYVVDEPAASDLGLPTLAPPVPHVYAATPSLNLQPPLAPSSPSRSPIMISAGGSSKSRRNKFGLSNLLKTRRSSSNVEADSLASPSADVPASRRVPSSPPQQQHPPASSAPHDGEDFVAHMTLPAELFQPATNGHYPSTSGYDEPSSSDAYQPRDQALPPVLVPKGGVSWPYDARVNFFRGPEFEKLAWGGFEVDIVGVRKNLLSHSYIIRVRRPARLDEYVIRSESQFHRFYKALAKAYPQAHVRRIPTSDPKNDLVIRPPAGSLTAAPSSTSLVSGMPGQAGLDSPLGPTMSRTTSQSRSRLANGLRAAAGDPHNTLAPSRTSTRNSTGSTFARSLRAQSVHAGDVKAVRSRHSRSNTITSLPARPQSAAGSYRSFPTTLGSRFPMPGSIGKRMPPHDPRRRALRTWLRDVLSIRTVGHSRETAAFLLLGSITPRDSDVLDIQKRDLIDDARRTARLNIAQGTAERVRQTRKQWSTVERDIIHGEGLSEVSEALRTSASLDKLPLKFQKVLESLRFNVAETLFEVLVAGESSGSTFAKLKSLHAAFPYFLVKQALRIKASGLMSRALQDILLSRPFGGKSLLQKILATCLDDDPVRLAKEMDRLQARVGSAVMCEKLNIFVHDSREKKAIIRRYSEENNLELVLCIVRGADEPRLPGFELDRITKATKAYRKFAKTNPTPLAKAQVQDPDIRLVLDLQAYLRLASHDRDSTVLRQMLAEEGFAAAIEVVADPFVQLLRRTYKVGNGAQLLSDFQKFLDQLIIIVEALRSRVQDPQKSIRILARLLARRQQSAYTFVRSVHRNETLVEEGLQWAWTASVFLRRGLAQPINLDELLPPPEADEKAYLLEELEDLVSYHTQKRYHQFEAACRRYAGDVDADDPVLIEGDGKGRSQVEPVQEQKPKRPVLGEIPLYAAAFKEQLRHVFAV
ncbi:hypothetical protein JCM8097_006928 [Rhodosporidiobolus ruineniae]